MSFADFLPFKESPKEELKLKEHLIQQAFLCIHGQSFEKKWKGKSMSLYFEKVKINPVVSIKNYDNDDTL